MTGSPVRAFRPDDLPALQRLLTEVFSPAVAARAHWKYLENPALARPVVAVATQPDGELAGCYPFVGREFAASRGTILAGLAADIAVRPAHRGGHLYYDLSVLAGDLAREARMAFAYGFPNPETIRVARRVLKVRDWAVLEAWGRPLQSPGVALVRRALGRLSPGERDGPGRPPSTASPPGAGVRDARFLAWRFGDQRRYRWRAEAGAYLILARGDRLGRDRLVVDFGPAGAEAELAALLGDEVSQARGRGVERLWIFCLPGSAMARVAASLQFTRTPGRDKPATVDPLGGTPPLPPPHLTIADADDP